LNLDRETQRPEETIEQRNEEYATVINIRVLGKVLDLYRGGHSQETEDKTPRNRVNLDVPPATTTTQRVKAKIISDRGARLPISRPRGPSCCRTFASGDVASSGEAAASEKVDFAPGNQKPEATKERMSDKDFDEVGTSVTSTNKDMMSPEFQGVTSQRNIGTVSESGIAADHEAIYPVADMGSHTDRRIKSRHLETKTSEHDHMTRLKTSKLPSSY
jgi:hypothetical protein